ncbi:MAG: cytochrome c biogenesis protein ResB [Deltaproteobacteria bacterium]|nr:cytochrome c biogenesis protein ResB [Deltaproteobacteria bacterium]
MQQSTVMTNIRRVASLQLTLVGMLLLGAGVFVYYRNPNGSSLWIEAPLGLLVLNLLAALMVNAKFRRQPPLLGFHICLLLIVFLAGVGRLTYFDGRLEIAEGQALDPAQVEVTQQGAFHRWQLAQGSFEQGEIRVNYAPGVRREATRSVVRIRDSTGRWRTETIGDDAPLIVDGYRFYTTSNKGWAILLNWHGADGEALRGVVHLPSYPFRSLKQVRDWNLPSGERVELRLELPEVPREKAWALQRDGQRATLVVKLGERVQPLEPGDSLRLGQGTLQFEGLRIWMGYRVSFNPILPWIAAAAVAAVLFMAWHFRLAFDSNAAENLSATAAVLET